MWLHTSVKDYEAREAAAAKAQTGQVQTRDSLARQCEELRAEVQTLNARANELVRLNREAEALLAEKAREIGRMTRETEALLEARVAEAEARARPVTRTVEKTVTMDTGKVIRITENHIESSRDAA